MAPYAGLEFTDKRQPCLAWTEKVFSPVHRLLNLETSLCLLGCPFDMTLIDQYSWCWLLRNRGHIATYPALICLSVSLSSSGESQLQEANDSSASAETREQTMAFRSLCKKNLKGIMYAYTHWCSLIWTAAMPYLPVPCVKSTGVEIFSWQCWEF